MKIKTQENYNRSKRQVVYGISIQIDGGHRYCKYPLGHQNYPTHYMAEQAAEELRQLFLEKAAYIEYPESGSLGVNKPEYVRIKTTFQLAHPRMVRLQ